MRLDHGLRNTLWSPRSDRWLLGGIGGIAGREDVQGRPLEEVPRFRVLEPELLAYARELRARPRAQRAIVVRNALEARARAAAAGVGACAGVFTRRARSARRA